MSSTNRPVHLTTDPGIVHVLEELKRREPVFHQPEFGTARADFEQQTDAAFWEVGASGRIYSREYVLDELERRAGSQEEKWQATDFSCREIAPDNYLLTYTLVQADRVTRRATIWRRAGADWKILYHQGTIVADP